MHVFHFVKHFAADRRCNSRDQLISHANIECADAAAGATSFAAGALTVAAAVENGDVGNDDFNKTII